MSIERHQPHRHPLTALWARMTQLMRFPGLGGSGYGAGSSMPAAFLGGLLPGSDINWAVRMGDPSLNSVVFGCLRWIVDNIAEPEPIIEERTAKGWVRVQTHPLLAVLDSPNPEYDGDQLHQAAGADYPISGVAYWVAQRTNRGDIARLWWKPSWRMRPVYPSDGSQFCTGYVYRADQGGAEFYAKEDVIQFRWGLDGQSEGRVGIHRTMPIAREITSLNEGATYTHAILSNVGVPTYLFNPKDAGGVSTDALKTFREWFQARFTRDGRGKPLIPSVPVEAMKLGLSPEEMKVDLILRRPELRVCSAFGIHPACVFVETGPRGFDNGGQQSEARKQSYQECLVPMLKAWARTLTKKELAREARVQGRELRLRYDFSQVEALAEDRNALHERIREDYRAGLITRNQALQETGRPAVAGGDTYYQGAIQ